MAALIFYLMSVFVCLELSISYSYMVARQDNPFYLSPRHYAAVLRKLCLDESKNWG